MSKSKKEIEGTRKEVQLEQKDEGIIGNERMNGKKNKRIRKRERDRRKIQRQDENIIIQSIRGILNNFSK